MKGSAPESPNTVSKKNPFDPKVKRAISKVKEEGEVHVLNAWRIGNSYGLSYGRISYVLSVLGLLLRSL